MENIFDRTVNTYCKQYGTKKIRFERLGIKIKIYLLVTLIFTAFYWKKISVLDELRTKNN
jgi:hypothetical protein